MVCTESFIIPCTAGGCEKAGRCRADRGCETRTRPPSAKGAPRGGKRCYRGDGWSRCRRRGSGLRTTVRLLTTGHTSHGGSTGHTGWCADHTACWARTDHPRSPGCCNGSADTATESGEHTGGCLFCDTFMHVMHPVAYPVVRCCTIHRMLPHVA